MHLLSVCLAGLAVVSSLVNASPGGLKQAEKREVIARLKWMERRQKYNILRARASVTPCAGTVLAGGACCSASQGTPTGTDGAPDTCCPLGTVIAEGDGYSDCCLGAAGKVPDPNAGGIFEVCCYGTIYTVSGTNTCCPTGQDVTADGQTCCAPGEIAQGNVCLPTRNRAKRYLVPDGSAPSAPIDLLKGHTRITLSPVQVAQYLTQNGVFEHEGETYVDHHHRRTNENLFHHLLGRGLSMGARWVSKSGISVADVHDKITHYPLSPNYEFAMADVPEIYSRIVADPDFEDFHWKGARFDKETLHRLVSPHPAFNETLVEEYALDFQFQGKRWRN